MIQETKLKIWNHRKVKRCPINLQSYADKAGVRLPITQVEEAEKLLKFLNKGSKRKLITISDEHFKRYRDAKLNYHSKEYPQWVKDGHFIEPDKPDVSTANGLTSFIQQHTTWMGCHANRINTTGRKIGGKWITGTTKKGTADVALIIQGRSIHLEVKVGKDKASPAQLKQQEQVRRAGGVYEFISTVEQYFEVFDRYYCKQSAIFDV